MNTGLSSQDIQNLESALQDFCAAPACVRIVPVQVPEGADQVEHRRQERIDARKALDQVMLSLGETSLPANEVHFPHRQWSISHCHGLAAACGVASNSRALGIGLDIEQDRIISERVARFLLREGEEKKIPMESNTSLLRLWTVKEAVFKADPHNKDRVLRHYEVLDFEHLSGEAILVETQAKFRYTSLPLEKGGWISVAAFIQP